MICYVFYVLNKPDVRTEFAHSYIPKGNIVFIYTYKCVDGRYILQQAKTLSYCVSLAINVKKKVTILEALTENQTSKSINCFL